MALIITFTSIARKNSMGARWSGRWGRLAVVCLSLLAALILGEVLTRVTVGELITQEIISVFEESPWTTFTLRPNIDSYSILLPEKERYRVITNAQGLRVADPSVVYHLNKPERRVLLVGDSFVFGYGMDYEHTIAGNLEKIVDVQVVNLGYHVGQTVSDYLAYFTNAELDLSHSFVVHAIFMGNDLFNMFVYERANNGSLARVVNPSVVITQGFRAPRASNTVDVWLQISSRMYFVTRKAMVAVKHMVGRAPNYERTYVRQVYRDSLTATEVDQYGAFIGHLLEFDSLIREAGGQVIHIIVPSGWQVDKREWEDLRYFHHDPETVQAGYQSQWINSAILRLGRERGLEVYDLIPHFQKRIDQGDPVFYNQVDGHFNRHGGSVVAQLIREFMGDRL